MALVDTQRFAIPWRRLRLFFACAAILLLLGLLTRPIEGPAWDYVKSSQPAMQLDAVEDAMGEGLIVGVFGGFRTVIADFLWIQLNLVWEKNDRVKLDAMARLVTSLDPRPDFFWINGSRMIAYDVPHWRISEEGGYDEVSDARQYAINEEQAEQAFRYLRQAMEYHPGNYKFPLEMGQIYLNRLKDEAKAGEWFLKTSQMEGAPFFVERIYAELLRRQGKNDEAYAYLKDLFRRLPDDNPYAQKGIVLERIRELEEDLKVAPLMRFQPDADFLK
ncbi:tetratricopeptide repeat protein [Coraliomargarita parva]|uniref:tetratricopeptide repeat protein n=1 Tax=Coraliomargarita parva TaxID=3014050 RepID=UPI0022B559EC|nr:hypothetical protein [Coraliomargarita parva]